MTAIDIRLALEAWADNGNLDRDHIPEIAREIAALSTLPIAGEGKVKALDWSNFDGPTINKDWKPTDQDLIYEALNFVAGDYGDADDNAAEQIIELLLTAWRASLTSSPGKDGGQGRILPDNEDFRQGYSAGYADAYGDVSDLKAKITALKADPRPQPASTALEPFARIADMEEKLPDGASTMVNVSRCRDARSALSASQSTSRENEQ